MMSKMRAWIERDGELLKRLAKGPERTNLQAHLDFKGYFVPLMCPDCGGNCEPRDDWFCVNCGISL